MLQALPVCSVDTQCIFKEVYACRSDLQITYARRECRECGVASFYALVTGKRL